MKKLLSIFTSIAFNDKLMVDVQLNPNSSIEVNLMNFRVNALAQNWTDLEFYIVQDYCLRNPDKAFGALIILTTYKFRPDVETIIKQFNAEHPYIHGLTVDMVQTFLTKYSGPNDPLMDYLLDYVLAENLCDVQV